jgi:hypothetical protein
MWCSTRWLGRRQVTMSRFEAVEIASEKSLSVMCSAHTATGAFASSSSSLSIFPFIHSCQEDCRVGRGRGFAGPNKLAS